MNTWITVSQRTPPYPFPPPQSPRTPPAPTADAPSAPMGAAAAVAAHLSDPGSTGPAAVRAGETDDLTGGLNGGGAEPSMGGKAVMDMAVAVGAGRLNGENASGFPYSNLFYNKARRPPLLHPRCAEMPRGDTVWETP